MKKYFTITYEVVGSRNSDTIMIWATCITQAIELFINTEFCKHEGYSLKYTEYAIIKIEA